MVRFMSVKPCAYRTRTLFTPETVRRVLKIDARARKLPQKHYISEERVTINRGRSPSKIQQSIHTRDERDRNR